MRRTDRANRGRRPAAPTGADAVPAITASAIGEATFCPYALYLRESGAAPSAASVRRRAEGTGAHETWTERQTPVRSGTWRTALVLLLLGLAAALVVAVVLGVTLVDVR